MLKLAIIGIAMASPDVSPAEGRQEAQNLQSNSGQGWSERGVFAFGGRTFDFQRGLFGTGVNGGKLEDCSTAEWYCMSAGPSRMSGDRFELLLPRSCGMIRDAQVGDVWSLGPVQTAVLAIWESRTPRLHAGTGTDFILGHESLPHVIYQYDKEYGVRAMIWDAGHKLNFVKMARDGRLREWLAIGPGEYDKLDYIDPLTTFDPFGQCR